jgi:hypothetical protein
MAWNFSSPRTRRKFSETKERNESAKYNKASTNLRLRLGRAIQKKWLDRADSLDEDVLSVPDFSTTGDLYGVVGNINKIRIMPVGAVDMYALLIACTRDTGRSRCHPV